MLYQAWEAQTTCRKCKGVDGMKSLRNTVLEVQYTLIYRNAEGVHGQRKLGNPLLSQTYVFYSTSLCACAHDYLFSENLNFSPVQGFCCWACDRTSTNEKYKW